jgi:hypothetical protein
LYGQKKWERPYTKFDVYFERNEGTTREEDNFTACAIMYMERKREKPEDNFIPGVNDYMEFKFLKSGTAKGSAYNAIEMLWNRLIHEEFTNKSAFVRRFSISKTGCTR